MEDFLLGLVTNKVLVSAAASWFVAQCLKIILEGIKNGFSKERLAGGGGMPSSHSATVLGLTTATAIQYGTHGFEFVIALFFAIIVMYDARGVRYVTGREAAILNKLRDRDAEEGREPLFDKALDDKMGHTIPEIIIGVLIGIVVGVVVCHLMP